MELDLAYRAAKGIWVLLMPPDEKSPADSESLRESIRRLSAQSNRLRQAAKENAAEAERIVEVVAEIKKRMAEAEKRKGKKTSGRICRVGLGYCRR
jgi:hypothetical protein